jgi:hypothetical protein
MVTFRVALRDEFGPFANVSIQATESRVYNKTGYEHKLVNENIDHNCYIAGARAFEFERDYNVPAVQRPGYQGAV